MKLGHWKERLTRLSEENVKIQVKHLNSLSLIRDYIINEDWFQDFMVGVDSVETGTIKVLVDGNEAPRNEMKQLPTLMN